MHYIYTIILAGLLLLLGSCTNDKHDQVLFSMITSRDVKTELLPEQKYAIYSSCGKVLHVQLPQNDQNNAPAEISLFSHNDDQNQQWLLVADGLGGYYLQSYQGKMLDATCARGACHDGCDAVSISPFGGLLHQRWKLVPAGSSDEYYIKSSSGKVLTASCEQGKRCRNNQPVRLSPLQESSSQRWRIKLVE